MGPFNILHVLTKLSAGGGIGNQLLALLKKYERGTFIPTVCSLSEKGPLARDIESLGIEVVSLGIEFRKGFYPGAVIEIYRLLKKKKIHILRCHGYRSSLHGVPAGLFAKVPCIVPSFHNIYMPRDAKFNRRLTNKLVSYCADSVVTVSSPVKEDVMKYDRVSEKKIVVLHNGVNPERFVHANGLRLKQELNIPASAPVIGTVGRLFSQKGQQYLIEALPLLKNDFPDLRLILVGDGPLRAEFVELSHRLGIRENVILTGLRRDIPDILAAMDVFVFPSLWEGFSNALLEAMSAGRPIVASDIPPVREIISSADQAVLVPPKDPSALAKGIKYILGNKEKAVILGETARQRVLSDFTIDITYEKYKKLYLAVLEGKGLLQRGTLPGSNS
jgi:glycosyltransferase involved in cell wall biosynthesis